MINQANTVPATKPATPPRIDRKLAPLQPGYYTVSLEGGGHMTFRIDRMAKDAKFAPGQLILSRLVGPDNTTQYKGVAFVAEDNRRAFLWRKYQEDKKLVQAVAILSQAPGEAASGYALKSGRCYVCGRLLTTPDSIASGIGPVCADRGF